VSALSQFDRRLEIKDIRLRDSLQKTDKHCAAFFSKTLTHGKIRTMKFSAHVSRVGSGPENSRVGNSTK
jgi:hypothetical protein